MAPHELFLQRSLKKTTRGLMSGCEDFKQFCLTEEILENILVSESVFFLAEISEVVLHLEAGRHQWRTTWIAFPNHRPLPEWIISIVPKMDGNFLHDLLATSVRAGPRLSSGPLACLLICSRVLVNIQGALT